MQQMKRLFSSKEFLVLNGILFSALAIIIYFLPFRPTDELLFFSSDSQTYYSSGGEFFDLTKQGHSLTRPFLYSIFLRGFYTVGGTWLIVILHLLFWIISANLIYYSIRLISNQLIMRIVALSLYIANISLITYAFHGLTELFTVFLLSLLTYLSIQSFKKGINLKYVLIIVFLLSLLTVTKPLFQHFAFCVIFFMIIRFSRTLLANKKYILFLFLAVSPLLLQLSIMKAKYGVAKISIIGSQTFNDYIFAQGIREIEGISDIQESRNKAKAMSNDEKINYLLRNKKTFWKLLLDNVKKNVTGDGGSFIVPQGYSVQKHLDYMISYNTTLYSISKFFLFLFMAISIIDLFSKKLFQHWAQLVIGLLLYYIVFSSGISFWQGDRLVIFSIPLWITLYIILLTRIINSNFVKRFFPVKVKKNEVWSN